MYVGRAAKMFVAPAERGQRPRVTEKTFGAVSGATRGNGTEMKAVNQAFEQKKRKHKKKNKKKMWLFRATPRKGGIEVEAPALDCRNERS